MLFPHGGGEIVTGLSVLGMGTFLFWNRLNPRQLSVYSRPEKISKTHFNQLCTEVEEIFRQIQRESEDLTDHGLAALKEALSNIQASCDRDQLRVAITGDVGVGKTALLKQLELTATVSEVTWSGEDFYRRLWQRLISYSLWHKAI
ncbi:MAG: hypothetical protein HC810_06375 [Acaryochloridaceae cyanobacterium RL_2_7]|nr:hypothetical protein [Acaryochloridaceae cyanobacterium RL_2_7]